MEDNKEQYPLTLEHVKQYLATKQDNESVGVCYNSLCCLLTKTLDYIYPEQAPWRVDINQYSTPRVGSFDLTIPLRRLELIFDHQSPKWGIEVSKGQWRRYLAKKEIKWPEEEEAPFTFSDLFDGIEEK
jgi:hypothetical protein